MLADFVLNVLYMLLTPLCVYLCLLSYSRAFLLQQSAPWRHALTVKCKAGTIAYRSTAQHSTTCEKSSSNARHILPPFQDLTL